MKRALAAVALLALTLPSFAFAQTEPEEETKFDPSHEWELHTWGPELKIGPIDMSINKAVAYLLLGTLVLDPPRARPDAREGRTRPEPAPGARRDDLRGRAGPGRRAGPPDEGHRTLVPVRRDADDLHLGHQHDRLHPAAALGRALGDRRHQHPDVRDLRRDLDALGHARARAHDVDVHPRRGDPRERRDPATSRAGSRTCRRRCCR